MRTLVNTNKSGLKTDKFPPPLLVGVKLKVNFKGHGSILKYDKRLIAYCQKEMKKK